MRVFKGFGNTQSKTSWVFDVELMIKDEVYRNEVYISSRNYIDAPGKGPTKTNGYLRQTNDDPEDSGRMTKQNPCMKGSAVNIMISRMKATTKITQNG